MPNGDFSHTTARQLPGSSLLNFFISTPSQKKAVMW